MDGSNEEGWTVTGEAIAALGAVVTVVGSVLPWIAGRPAASLGGTPGGPVTALLAIGVFLVVVFRPWVLVDAIVVGALGLATVLVGANAVMTFRTSADLASAGPAIGVYVVLLGGVVVVIGAGVGFMSDAVAEQRATPRGS